MRPLRIVAELMSAPVVTGPILFDGILLAARGEIVGAEREDGWADPEQIRAMKLPLARIVTPHGWWYAASQATPQGPESTHHLHRRPPAELYLDWTTERSFSVGSGPDKALRIPMYRRIGMLALEWTCIGHPGKIRAMLAWVPAVGRTTAHGHGWVRSWRVEEIDRTPDFRSDVRARHMPIGAVERPPPEATRRRLPLRPPYHRRADAVEVWQVPAC